jgi:hypothetical protein
MAFDATLQNSRDLLMAKSFFMQDGSADTATSLGIVGAFSPPPAPITGSFGAVWGGCAVTYSPDDCSNPSTLMPKQINSLISNLAGLGHCLVDWKAKDTGQNLQVQACDDEKQYNWISSAFCDFLSKAITKGNLVANLTEISCPAANGNGITAPPLDAALFYVKKGATLTDLCEFGVTNIQQIINLVPPPSVEIHSTGFSLSNTDLVLTDNNSSTPDLVVPLSQFNITIIQDAASGLWYLNQGANSILIPCTCPPEPPISLGGGI